MSDASWSAYIDSNPKGIVPPHQAGVSEDGNVEFVWDDGDIQLIISIENGEPD